MAIKVLIRPIDRMDEEAQAIFDREVANMSSMRHPHVLTFYGAGIMQATENAFLVTELMEHGSLKSILYDTAQDLSWTTRLRFAADGASGMRYLHYDVGMVHRDIKADNFFVSGDFRVKVSDLLHRVPLSLSPLPSVSC